MKYISVRTCRVISMQRGNVQRLKTWLIKFTSVIWPKRCRMTMGKSLCTFYQRDLLNLNIDTLKARLLYQITYYVHICHVQSLSAPSTNI